MAISETQKVDYLWKKLAYGLSKTDTNVNKRATNESIASPLLLRGSNVWAQSDLIPGVMPGSSSGVVTVYPTGSPDETTADASATLNRTWKTGLIDWISPEFGSTYLVKVYIHTAGDAGNAAASGTQIFGAGSGNNDEWFFDYQSGILHFIGTNLPSGISGKSIYVSGARYTGIKGVAVPGDVASFTDLNITGVSTFSDTVHISSLTNNRIPIVGSGSTIEDDANLTFDGSTLAVGVDLDVDGRTELDIINISETLNVTGIATFANNIDANGDLDVDGHTELDDLRVSGVATFQSHVHLGDDDELRIGDGNDLKLLHNGFNSIINDEGVGDLYLGGNSSVNITNAALSEFKAKFITDGAVELYHDASKKFETTGIGVSIYDDLNVGTGVTIYGNAGIVSATTFYGDGSQLSNLPSSGLNEIREEGSIVGTSITSLNFVGNNITATGVGAAATVTLSETPTFDSLSVTGLSTFVGVATFTTNDVYIANRLFVGGGVKVTGIVTATTGFATTNGTSSQFLKADGSVDSSTYLSSYTETQSLDDVVGLGSATSQTITVGTATTGVVIRPDGDLNVSGNLNVSGVSTFSGNVNLGQSDKLLFNGTSGLEIYENGTVGVIQANNNSGRITIEVNNTTGSNTSSELIQLRGTGNLISANFKPDSGVQLYGRTGSNSAEVKLETTADGIAVSGIVTAFSGIVTYYGDGSNLTGFTPGQVGALANLIEDTDPQLGGDLDVNGNDITGTGNVNLTGVITATSFTGNLTGTASTATALETARNFEITGDIVASAISFDGTNNVSLAATIQPDSVAMGTDTTGDYVESVSGTANEISVTGGTGEGSTPTIGFVANPTIGGNVTIGQDLTVTRDLQVTRNLNVDGTVTIGGTSATIFAETLKITDPDLILGVRTDANGNDISTDNTANHGGVALASTEGTPLVTLVNPGAGETLPSTYKKIMWFKSGSFTGLNTDAWISNYAFGVGTTSMSAGTKFAVGNIEADFDDITLVRNINSSGIITATSFSGNGASLTNVDATTLDTFDSSQFLRSDVATTKTSGDLIINDGVDFKFGTGSDLNIGHNGSSSNINQTGTGPLLISNSVDDSYISIRSDNGSGGIATYFQADGSTGESILYHYGSQKLATKSNGIDVTGHTETDTLNVSGVSTLGTVKISSGIVTASSGVVTYYGDGSKLSNLAAAGAIEGLIVIDESGNTVGTSGSITTLSFEGSSGVTVTATSGPAGIATVVVGGFSPDADQNLVAGDSAGANLDGTSGCHNVFIGSCAGKSNTSGYENIFIGKDTAACGTVTGHQNIAIGSNAGKQLTTGCGNIFLGDEVGACNTTGDYNFIAMTNAGLSGTCSCDNVIIGINAGYANNGNANIFLGRCAGRDNSTGGYNLYLGCKTGQEATTGNYNVFLGHEAVSGGIVTGNDNISVGRKSGCCLTSGCQNIFLGLSAGRKITTAGDNIMIGRSVAAESTATACSNIVMGLEAGYNMGSACNNVVIGTQAGCDVTGRCNVFLGFQAGVDVTSGCHNIFLGTYSGGTAAGGIDNISIGKLSGRCVSSGDHNIFLGSCAGKLTESASNNIFLGRCAGCTNTSGSANIAIGKDVVLPSATASAQLAIGCGTNRWIAGDNSYNVGIGSATPSQKLDVAGNIAINQTTVVGSATSSLSSISQTAIHSGLSTSIYRSVEYTIQATQGTNFHATKILALHNGTTAYNNEYGTIYNNSSVATFDVDISGGNLRLLATGASTEQTDYVINFIGVKL